MKQIHLSIALVFFGLCLTVGSAGAGQTMSLAQCLETGVRANPHLEASRLEISMAEADRKSVRADFLPSLRTDYGVSLVSSINAKGAADDEALNQNVKNFSLRLSQILYSGSRIFNAYGRAQIRESLMTAEMELRRLELEYQIEATFFRLMKAKEDVISATESVLSLEEGVKAAQSFFDHELVPYVDVLQAQVDLADARERLGMAQNDVNRERIQLFSFMNLPEDPGIIFQDSVNQDFKAPAPFEENQQKAFDRRPDIKSLEFQFDLARKDAKIARGHYLPVVRLDAGYTDQERDYEANYYDRRNRYWSAGVSASWELFDGGRAFYEYQRHNIQADRIKVLIKDAKNTISTGIRRALYAMSEARQRIEVSRQTLAAAREYYAGEEKRLMAGVSTIPALLSAHERVVRAQGSHTQASLDFHLAQSELKLMTGGAVAPQGN